ncbi:MAG: hypothetical protein ACTHJK_05190 [Sphingomicrobium sp.]
MAVEAIHPGGRAKQSNASAFGRIAAAIDEADRVGGERIGGPTTGELYDLGRLERRLYRLRPVTAADWQWLARRLARALENGWGREAAAPLLRLAM